jgi:hypothetical protein
MYVPPLDALLRSIGKQRSDFVDGKKISVPVSVLRLLLQMALASGDFNEAGYLRVNEDLAKAVTSNEIDNPRLHYVGFGYFEGRLGATPDVDEKWYLKTYPDVAAAIKAGQISNPQEHFDIIGSAEGRSPNSSHQVSADQWKRATKA